VLIYSDPYLLTTFLVEKAIENGATLIQAKATQLTMSNNTISKVHAITSSGEQISLDCDALVIAAGPWTGELTRTFNLPNPIPITSYAGHSIVLRLSTPNDITSDERKSVSDSCLFMSLSISRNSYHPEIFPRPNGQIYICGINSDLPLPSTPLLAQPIPTTISQLHSIADSLFGDTYVVEKEQVCFRPMTGHGEPFVGSVRGVNGVWVGAGHSFWGITLGLGTGLVLSEMVLGRSEGELSADVSGLRP
jgi:glycine/D-amino acid oxidase-like deaminating enzyme